jgi:hypothetical protein
MITRTAVGPDEKNYHFISGLSDVWMKPQRDWHVIMHPFEKIKKNIFENRAAVKGGFPDLSKG